MQPCLNEADMRTQALPSRQKQIDGGRQRIPFLTASTSSTKAVNGKQWSVPPKIVPLCQFGNRCQAYSLGNRLFFFRDNRDERVIEGVGVCFGHCKLKGVAEYVSSLKVRVGGERREYPYLVVSS